MQINFIIVFIYITRADITHDTIYPDPVDTFNARNSSGAVQQAAAYLYRGRKPELSKLRRPNPKFVRAANNYGILPNECDQGTTTFHTRVFQGNYGVPSYSSTRVPGAQELENTHGCFPPKLGGYPLVGPRRGTPFKSTELSLKQYTTYDAKTKNIFQSIVLIASPQERACR